MRPWRRRVAERRPRAEPIGTTPRSARRSKCCRRPVPWRCGLSVTQRDLEEERVDGVDWRVSPRQHANLSATRQPSRRPPSRWKARGIVVADAADSGPRARRRCSAVAAAVVAWLGSGVCWRSRSTAGRATARRSRSPRSPVRSSPGSSWCSPTGPGSTSSGSSRSWRSRCFTRATEEPVAIEQDEPFAGDLVPAV